MVIFFGIKHRLMTQFLLKSIANTVIHIKCIEVTHAKNFITIKSFSVCFSYAHITHHSFFLANSPFLIPPNSPFLIPPNLSFFIPPTHLSLFLQIHHSFSQVSPFCIPPISPFSNSQSLSFLKLNNFFSFFKFTNSSFL